ncbi:MAG: hypothetical protein EBT90_12185 [Rhodobacteraceae bacterium]|nr:hypothetical protein [Paracoccaceae bacterium]
MGIGYPFKGILFRPFWRLSLGDATPKAKDVTKPFATDGLFRLPGGVLTISYAIAWIIAFPAPAGHTEGAAPNLAQIHQDGKGQSMWRKPLSTGPPPQWLGNALLHFPANILIFLFFSKKIQDIANSHRPVQ